MTEPKAWELARAEKNAAIDAVLTELGLTVVSEFVPWSKSRNAKPKPKIGDYSLNWKVTLQVKGRDILTTDYGAGIAHCPAHAKASFRGSYTVDGWNQIVWECENGFYSHHFASLGGFVAKQKNPLRPADGRKKIEPETRDVIYSLQSDGEAIDSPTYEEWASNFGYDLDSRKGEATYRQCVEIGLKLRAALGEAGLAKLREAFQDF